MHGRPVPKTKPMNLRSASMKTKKWIGAAVAAAIPALCQANSWSSCQTITAVSNYTTHESAVYVILSPGISGCHADAPGATKFKVGQMGVTADALKGFLATALAAYLSGKQVMIHYDETSPSCHASIISVGGWAAQCN